ncbi:hypothetical protein ACKFKF_24500 [Phormidesmis sp. 146-12]
MNRKLTPIQGAFSLRLQTLDYLNPLQVRDFEPELFSYKSPRIGGWEAEDLNTEAKEL